MSWATCSRSRMTAQKRFDSVCCATSNQRSSATRGTFRSSTLTQCRLIPISSTIDSLIICKPCFRCLSRGRQLGGTSHASNQTHVGSLVGCNGVYEPQTSANDVRCSTSPSTQNPDSGTFITTDIWIKRFTVRFQLLASETFKPR